MAKKVILLVDDDLDDQELFGEAMSIVDREASCYFASDGEEGLRMLENESLECDLIFLDLNMPKMNGKQFLAEIKKNNAYRDIPVVIFSTSLREKDGIETAEMGAAHFLTKPSSFGELCKQLESVLTKALAQ
ncbi:response regulator [Chitinophaga pinensis]|uniref:Response regulator receiver protein n=1 Tax=Chitinophaga pinensis (strain ATCC 43595 / DSM 2588 / LMG 13176 / NBRC 15968 / NCIMB 11800 / UQM 2034) TaxID=485918 RepID=A0A979GN74_CHIPD|nr:response regulator [Chitinophaga pinensis]ACU59287.1 response regulator receiver protein [Chitinophaga pinensis DSM 2588]